MKMNNLNKMKELKCIYKSYTPQLICEFYSKRGLKNNYRVISVFGNLNYYLHRNTQINQPYHHTLNKERTNINSQNKNKLFPTMKAKNSFI